MCLKVLLNGYTDRLDGPSKYSVCGDLCGFVEQAYGPSCPTVCDYINKFVEQPRSLFIGTCMRFLFFKKCADVCAV